MTAAVNDLPEPYERRVPELSPSARYRQQVKRRNPQNKDPRESMERILSTLKVVDEPRMYRCHVCKDVGWIETDETGRGTVRRCLGPKGSGCPHEEHRKSRATQETDGEVRYS